MDVDVDVIDLWLFLRVSAGDERKTSDDISLTLVENCSHYHGKQAAVTCAPAQKSTKTCTREDSDAVFFVHSDLLLDTKMYCLVPNDSFASLQPSTSLCPSELSREPAELCNSAACHFNLSHSPCDTEVSAHPSQTFRKELRSRGLPRTSSSAGSAFPDPCLPDPGQYPPPRRGGLDPVRELETARPHRPGVGGRDGAEQLYQQDPALPSTSGLECCSRKEPCAGARSASREAGEGGSGLYRMDVEGGGTGKPPGGQRSADSLRSLSTRSSGSTESYCSGTDRDTNSTVSSFHSEQTSSTHVESLLSLSGDERARLRGDPAPAAPAGSRTSSLGALPSREANKNPHANEVTAKRPPDGPSSPTPNPLPPEEPGPRTSADGSAEAAAAEPEAAKDGVQPQSPGAVQRTSSLSAGRRGGHRSGKKRASSFDGSRRRDCASLRGGAAKPCGAALAGGGDGDSSDQSELSCASSLRSSHHLSTDSSSTTTSRSCHSPEDGARAPKAKHSTASCAESRRKRARGKQRAARRAPSAGSAKTHARVLSLDSGTAACLNDPGRLGAPAGPRPLTTSKSDLEAKEGEVLDAASLLGRASQLESVTRSRTSLPNQAAFAEPQDAAAAASLRGTYASDAISAAPSACFTAQACSCKC